MVDDSRVRLVVAEEQPLFIEGIVSATRTEQYIEFVGGASDGREACAAILEQRPSVALVSLELPRLDGFGVIEVLSRRSHLTRLIALSGKSDPLLLRRVLTAGFHGFILRRSAVENMIFAIRSVAAGGIYIDPSAATCVADGGMRSRLQPRGSHAQHLEKDLTTREEEVLRLVALGYTIKEMAAQLCVTEKSIETYKLRATDKLQLRSRAKIVQYGVGQGWFNHA